MHQTHAKTDKSRTIELPAVQGWALHGRTLLAKGARPARFRDRRTRRQGTRKAATAAALRD